MKNKFLTEMENQTVRELENVLKNTLKRQQYYSRLAEELTALIKGVRAYEDEDETPPGTLEFPNKGDFLEQVLYIEKVLNRVINTKDIATQMKAMNVENFKTGTMYNNLGALVKNGKLLALRVNDSKKQLYFTSHDEWVIKDDESDWRVLPEYTHPKIAELERKNLLEKIEKLKDTK